MLNCFLIVSFLVATDAKGIYYPKPYRSSYNLYTSGSAPHYKPGKPIGRHKNYCAFIVQRNITCIMQDGTETYIKAEYHKCAWGQKCPGVVMYRSFFKPKYKVGYKTITELEWRCCPGFSGDACQDGPTSLPELLPPFPGYKAPPGHKLPPDHRTFPGPKTPPGQKKGYYGKQMPGIIGEKIDHLEEEVRRLSQSFDNLQAMVNGFGDHLRLAIQEDTNKMIGSLMANPRVPDSTVGFGVIPDGVVDTVDKAGVTYPGVGDLMGRVTEVTNVLKTKTDLLDDVHGMVLGHDDQIKHLLEASRPSPLTSIDLLDEYINSRLTNFKAEILDGFEKRLTTVQNACDFRIKEIQQKCEEEKAANLRLQESLDGKETELKKDIAHLETQIQGLTVVENCCSNINYLTERLNHLEDSLQGISDYQKNLHSRFDNEMSQFSTVTLENFFDSRLEDIEARINATEREAKERCHDMEGNVRGLLGSEVDGVKILFDDKLKTLEDRFMTIVEELSNVSAPVTLDGDVIPLLETEIGAVKKETDTGLEILQSRLTTLEHLCTTNCNSISKEVGTMKTKIEDCQNGNQDILSKLDNNSDLLQKLNSTIFEIQRKFEEEETQSLQGEITLLKISLSSVNKSLRGVKDSVKKYADELGHVNSTREQHEHKITDDVHLIQDLVNSQGSQLMFSNKRIHDLKGELERIKSRLMTDLRNCKHVAYDIQKEVSQVENRVKEVENMCSSLGGITGSLDIIKEGLDKHAGSLWGLLDQMSGTIATHSQEISVLRDGLNDCRVKITEITKDNHPFIVDGENH
ncbi:EMILIN-3 [Latimeria chalumnae]|uniref:EMILIN-3 n=1 Tax=Latimeria chalumnae TaxID=7897 RepID=UPI00313E6131